MNENTFDVVVIGAGSGGLTTAVGLAKIGKKVLLVEREHMGGECTNSGCIPSKALLHYAKQYQVAKTVAGKTNLSEDFRRDVFTKVQTRINQILSEETPEHFEKLGIVVVLREASFTSKNSILVAGTTYNFRKAVIATGSSPRQLEVPGLNEADVLTNQNLFKLNEVPEKTLIIGGGPIGMEIGQAFAMLGSQVTIIDNGPRFARLEDEAISPIITKAFTDLGIKIILNAAVKQIVNKVAEIEIKELESEATVVEHIAFDKVLVAVGRVPNLPKGLDQAAVAFTPYGITVDENWQTTNNKIYALGDVSALMKFTHVADDTGRQIVAHIASKGLLSVKTKAIPKVTYTEPEIAQVGLSFGEASKTYGLKKVTRIEVPLSENDRAKTDEATEGVLVVIAKRLTGEIIGAHMIGPRAGEIISTLTLVMEQDISLYKIRSTIFAYPTYSLILKKAGDYFLAKQISTLKLDLFNYFKDLAPKVFAALLWAGALFWLYQFKIASGLSFTDISINIFTFITGTMWGPLLYILAYTIRPLTFFPGTALTILSGIFFGLWGILYTIIGANLSATVAYVVGRFFSQNPENKNGLLSGWSERLNKNPFMAILTMRLTFFPFDMVNFGSGLLRVKFPDFIAATFIGTLLGISTFVAIGSSLSVEEFIKNGISIDAINPTFIAVSAVIFITSHIAAKLLKRQ